MRYAYVVPSRKVETESINEYCFYLATGIALALVYTLPVYGVWSYDARINQARIIGPSQKKTALL